MSFYIGKVKVIWDKYPHQYSFGVTYNPRYRQLEFNFGKRLLQFWYRKEML